MNERGSRLPGAPYFLKNVPMPFFRRPWGPTEYVIAELVHHERGMTPGNWQTHARTLITYLESRLELDSEPVYREAVPDEKEAHERPAGTPGASRR